uniref:(northern house mosquito) hypothetical protein n=1 Tax=Culex pipiens TaxID=7175 RepID=A0A8D8E4Q0_CULPI
MTSLAGTDWRRLRVRNTPDFTIFHQISTPHDGRHSLAPLSTGTQPIVPSNFTPNRTDRKHAPFFFHGLLRYAVTVFLRVCACVVLLLTGGFLRTFSSFRASHANSHRQAGARLAHTREDLRQRTVRKESRLFGD